MLRAAAAATILVGITIFTQSAATISTSAKSSAGLAVADDEDDETPSVVKGLGNGGAAADSITILIETVLRVSGGPPNISGDLDGVLGGPSGSPSSPKDPMAGLGQIQDEKYCGWASLSTPLDAGDPAWDGNTAADGEVRWKSCAILGAGTPGAPGNLEGRPVEYQFFPNAALAAAAVPPPPDPQVIAQRAIRQLQVPAPIIGAGPDRGRLAVNLWTWLWIDDPGPLTATATAGGVSVTATATLASVTWKLGEPASTGGPYASGAPIAMTCQGTGSAPPTDYDWKAEPPCGHKYTWMSTKERTSGTGKWPITATSNWNVTWQSNTGVSGSTTLNSTGNDALEIGEYRTVLVQGPGG